MEELREIVGALVKIAKSEY